MWRATSAAAGLCIGTGAFEAILVVTLRPPYESGKTYIMTIVGVLAAIMISAGLIPPYFELARRNGRVIGINFLFLLTDWFGAFFSLMSLVAQNSFDILGGVQYSVCAALEVGIFMSHFIWLWRTRKAHKLAKEAGLNYDEYMDQESPEVSENHTKDESEAVV